MCVCVVDCFAATGFKCTCGGMSSCRFPPMLISGFGHGDLLQIMYWALDMVTCHGLCTSFSWPLWLLSQIMCRGLDVETFVAELVPS